MIAPRIDLRVQVFADGANLEQMKALAADPNVKGFTTNPTLMRQSGIRDYAAFAREVLKAIPDKPISFEVLADSPAEIRRQALSIATWGDNVYVKVPITTSEGEPLTDLAGELARRGVKVNVTAVFTLEQVWKSCEALRGGAPSVVSVFAGRIADSGVDPVPHMTACKKLVEKVPQTELLWASPREALNVVQADQVGCDIITVTPDLLAKLGTLGKGLEEFSLDTVKMFRDDAVKAGFALHRRRPAAA